MEGSKEARMNRCGTCRHFGSATYITNAMRLFGPEETAERTICKWEPPAPFWTEVEYRPQAVRDSRLRMDNARQVSASDGAYCRAWEPAADIIITTNIVENPEQGR